MTLNPDAPVMLVGSCFADNIRQRMRQCLWRAENPFGTLFNPLSIARVLGNMLDDDGESDFCKSLFQADGIWRSWMFDSHIAFPTREECLAAYRELRRVCHATLQQAEALFVTFGTSFCYFLKTGNHLVANCHKQSSALFERRRVSVKEIADEWNNLLKRLWTTYPNLQVIFTVSPVRHVRDGFVDNSRSKAVLLLAVEDLCSNHTQCGYFPAYEIVNDDLRGYRFYASDLVHPSPEAVEYVWEKLIDTYFSDTRRQLLMEGEKLYRRLTHRLIIAESESSRRFTADTQALAESFYLHHPTHLQSDEI